MPDLTITTATHFFRVNRITARARPCVDAFARKFVQYGLVKERGRFTQAPLKVYAAATADRQEYRFHIHELENFNRYLSDYLLRPEVVERKALAVPTPRMVELPIFPSWEDRNNQTEAIEYCLQPNIINHLLNLQTGGGKSYCSCRVASSLGVLTMYIFRPMYIDKWLIDIRKTFDIDPLDIMVIKGGNQLLSALQQGEKLKGKVILLSNKTLQNWIKLYELHRDGILALGYPCMPEDMMAQLRVGLRLMDEVHLDFHLNFKIDLYTNVQSATSMSATMISDDPYVNKMYEVAYPKADRFAETAYHKYIVAVGVLYSLADPDRIRYLNPQGMYSQHVFEQSLMKHKDMLQNFVSMLYRLISNTYLDGGFYKVGDKCLLYVASIDFATYLTDRFRSMFADLDVRRYVEDDDYENLMRGDLLISSLQKAGTNVDVPQLTSVLLPHAVMSSQSNVQGFGRLRQLKDGRTPRFVWMTCRDIPKHIEYHEKKERLLQNKALSVKLENYGTRI